MKKWTVMLIPHDRGSTRTLNVSSLHFWGVVSLLAVLTFSTAFLYQRDQKQARNAEAHRERIRALEWQLASTPPTVSTQGITDAEVKEIESRMSLDYESSIAAITAELTELHDMEAKAREIHLLEPRQTAEDDIAPSAGGGKGGPLMGEQGIGFSAVEAKFRPPHIIYGMLRPSADLILREIRVRTDSLSELVADMEVQNDRIARVPTARPIRQGVGRYSSHFGYRRDPFTRRVRHHSGTDISAPSGTSVYATGRGVVVFTAYDGEYGNLVKIDHGNGIQTWYAHLSRSLVKRGQVVEPGDPIGAVGSTGRSTGPHLHYEVRVSSKAIDARKYLPD